VAGRYHTRVFIEWRRVHQIVTLLLTPPTEAVVPVDGRPRPASAGKLPPSRAAVPVAFQHDSLPVELVHCLYDSQPLYSRCQTDGRWRFGRLPATSVSDTAAASTQPLAEITHKQLTDV